MRASVSLWYGCCLPLKPHALTVLLQPSRVGADFQIEVFDWNQIEQAKSLGSAKIELADLEPFNGVEREISLSHNKHGDKGRVSVRLMFQPEIIVKSRKNTSTFSTAGRAMTQIGHLPVGAGKGVLHGVTGVFRRGNGSDSEDDKVSVKDFSTMPAAGQASMPLNGNGTSLSAAAAGFATSNGNASTTALAAEPGTLRVTVLDAKDLSTADVKPFVTVRIGDKEQKTKHVKSATPEW